MNNFIKVLICAMGLILAAGAALAEVDYDAWARQAERSQAVISTEDVSAARLERLRAQLVDKRIEFEAAEAANAPEIATVTDQIAALGPPPEEGASEDEEIAARREALGAQLAELRAPGLRAEEAGSQVTGMIAQIDLILRERKTDLLMRQGSYPVLPGFWTGAFAQMHETLGRIFSRPEGKALFKWDEAPLGGVLLALGAVLIGRGRGVALALSALARKHTRRGTGVWDLIASLGQVVLPFAGALVVSVALSMMLNLTPEGEDLWFEIPLMALIMLAAIWLGRRLFPLEGAGLLQLAREFHAPLRRMALSIGATLALHSLIATLAAVGDWTPETRDAWAFPITLLGALLLWRLARLLKLARGEKQEGAQGFVRQMLQLVITALRAVALGGALLAFLAYHNAASLLVMQTLNTLILLGLLRVAQGFVADLWILISNGDPQDRDGLIPTLLGFALTLAALPVLALIWGAGATDLSELWQRFLRGFTIGATEISPGIFVTFAVVFAIGYMATRMLQSALRSSVLPKTRLDRGGQNALVSGVGYVGIFLAALIAITTAGLDLSGLAIVAGALSVGIGFGLQNIVSNFVSGVILLIERPIAIGDWIEVGGQQGYVRAISVRSTRIETFDRSDVIVPNADFVSGPVTNFTRSNTIGRLILPIGVAYGTDTRRVQELLLEVARDAPNVLAYPAPYVVFQAFGASTYDMELRVYLRDVNNGLSARTELNHRIRECFEREEIEVAFMQQDIWIRGMPGQDES